MQRKGFYLIKCGRGVLNIFRTFFCFKVIQKERNKGSVIALTMSLHFWSKHALVVSLLIVICIRVTEICGFSILSF